MAAPDHRSACQPRTTSDQMSLVRSDERDQRQGLRGFGHGFAPGPYAACPSWSSGGVPSADDPGSPQGERGRSGHRRQGRGRGPRLWFDARDHGGLDHSTFAVIEIGTAFTAVLVVQNGSLVDASAGTRGPIGIRSGGAWDGSSPTGGAPVEARPVSRRTRGPWSARSRRLSRVTDQACRGPSLHHAVRQALPLRRRR